MTLFLNLEIELVIYTLAYVEDFDCPLFSGLTHLILHCYVLDD